MTDYFDINKVFSKDYDFSELTPSPKLACAATKRSPMALKKTGPCSASSTTSTTRLPGRNPQLGKVLDSLHRRRQPAVDHYREG